MFIFITILYLAFLDIVTIQVRLRPPALIWSYTTVVLFSDYSCIIHISIMILRLFEYYFSSRFDYYSPLGNRMSNTLLYYFMTDVKFLLCYQLSVVMKGIEEMAVTVTVISRRAIAGKVIVHIHKHQFMHKHVYIYPRRFTYAFIVVSWIVDAPSFLCHSLQCLSLIPLSLNNLYSFD